MYRYVETEKYEGKTTRTGGITSASLSALKHLPKVGKVRYVRGYVYKGRFGAYHVGVLVAGELGTIRFGGFLWGYGGQGPRGLNQLFAKLGLDLDATSLVLGWSPNFNKASSGEHWRVTFLENGEKKITTRQAKEKIGMTA